MRIAKTVAHIIAIACIFVFLISACALFRKIEDNNFEETSMFCQVEDNSYWTIYYHKDTKVMWIKNKGTFGGGCFEVLIDSDGNPMIWQ